MGMTMTEKILAMHAGERKVEPGQIIMAKVDLCMGNDVTAPLAIREFRKIGVERVFDKDKIALVASHYVPNKDMKAAEQAKLMRHFAVEQNIKHYYEVGRGGVEHVLLPDRGLILPGMLYVGADSHTCTAGALACFATGIGSTDLAAVMATGEIWLRVPESIKLVYYGDLNEWVMGKDIILATIGRIGVSGASYKAMEFTGPVIERLGIADRFTITNMAVEAGAKNGIIPFDEVTAEYLRKVAPTRESEWQVVCSDEDARYAQVIEFDCSRLEPLVAYPHLPSNVRTISEAVKDNIAVDQVFIGSCTNGRIEDLRVAARVIKGKKVHPRVRMIVIPATHDVWLQALREGLLEVFADAGAVVSTETCGPCLGGHMGVLASGERCVSTSNRNFVGRMGDPASEVFLANPAVAAASAILGRIAHPDEV